MALRLAQEADQAKPNDPEICDTLGWIYLKKNTAGMAVEVLKKSVAKSPRNPQYNYHLGVAYLRAGNTAQAKKLLQSVLNMESSAPLAQDVKKMLVSIKN
jgi:predicted Zn-dependent protease